VTPKVDPAPITKGPMPTRIVQWVRSPLREPSNTTPPSAALAFAKLSGMTWFADRV